QAVTFNVTSSDVSIIPTPVVAHADGLPVGTLNFTPATNANGVVTLTVTADDGGSSNNVVTRTLQVTVRPVNDPPTISDLPDASTLEDTPFGPVTFVISDVETPAANLQVTVTSSDTNLVALAGLALAGAGTNRTLTVTPATNRSGTVTITLTVTDANSASASGAFALTETPVNDPPVPVHVLDQVTPEDTPLAVPVTIGDVETSADSLTLTAVSADPSIVAPSGITYGGSGSNRVVTLAPVPNAFGSTRITLNLSDGTTNVSDSFLLTVQSVNDPPTLDPISNVTVIEGSGPRQLLLTGI